MPEHDAAAEQRAKALGVPSGHYICGHCGYEGPCYGTPTGNGVSAPWCKRCQRNDKLTPAHGVQQPDGAKHG